MSYVTLLEASQIVQTETGVDITIPQLLRAGVLQNLPLCVLLDVRCYSPTYRIKREKRAEEVDPDYWRNCPANTINDSDLVYAYGLVVLPPRHVFQYQTKETVRVDWLSSLDGQDTYCPGVDVSRDALQIMLPHLYAFVAHIKATQFAQQQTAPAIDTAPPAPVAANGKKWTPEKLAELKSYRDGHGTQKAAEYFGVSEQLIRRKLPSKKLQPKGYSAFVHRMK